MAIAVSFYYISSPLVFEPVFDESLRIAVVTTTVACVLTIPWLRVPRVPWAALPFLAFGYASSFWSLNPDDTIHFLGLYVVLTLLGVVVASNVTTRVLCLGIIGGAVVVIAASLYAYWRELPGSDVLPGSSGLLAGVGTNRNILAYTMILALPFAVSFLPRQRWLRAGWAVAVLVVLGGIVLAESATGIVAAFLVSAVAVLLASRDHLLAKGLAPGRRYWVIVGGLTLVLVAIALAWYEALGRDLGRDLSLTGRVHVWASVWAATRAHTRVLGEGWGSVWAHPWRPSSPNGEFDNIIGHVGYYVAHGHNSVMDLLPEVGLVGVGLFGLIYLVPLLRAVVWRRRGTGEAREAGRLNILAVLALVLAGVTEPISVVPLGFYVAILIVVHVPGGSPAAEPATGEPAPS